MAIARRRQHGHRGLGRTDACRRWRDRDPLSRDRRARSSHYLHPGKDLQAHRRARAAPGHRTLPRSGPGQARCRGAAEVKELSTLPALLEARAEADPSRLLYTFLENDGTPSSRTRGDLFVRARAIAALLRSQSPPGARAVLLFPPGLDYID